MNKKDLKEEDLYIPVQTYFEMQGFEVKGEVNHCDITAVKDEIVIIVEMKKSLNLDVIIQAVQRQRLTDNVYIAVPKKYKAMKTRRWKHICHLLRRLEIGLLLVSIKDNSFRVEMDIKPEPFNRTISKNNKNKHRVMLIKEFSNRHGNYNKGGITGKKIVTAYREKVIHIAALLKKHGSLTAKQLKELGTDDKKTSSILQKNFYGWFERVSRGVYGLSKIAAKDMEKYKELVSFYENPEDS